MTNYTLKTQRFKISSHIQTFTKHKMRYNFTKKNKKLWKSPAWWNCHLCVAYSGRLPEKPDSREHHWEELDSSEPALSKCRQTPATTHTLQKLTQKYWTIHTNNKKNKLLTVTLREVSLKLSGAPKLGWNLSLVNSTSSSAVAKRSHDASYQSVVSFNSTKRRVFYC